MSKKLFVIVSDGGDGSYYPKFTMNEVLVQRLNRAYEDGRMDCENGMGCDGDGFHYETILVPDDATYESLGIKRYISDDYADKFFEKGEGYGGGHDA